MSLTIVMYHYVRDIKNSKYPNIKGLETQNFLKQIRYFKQNYYFIDYIDLLESINGNKTIPKNSILLTFDDGFVDSYTNIFPILKKEKIRACFFPISSTIRDNVVADVHKIHFILENFTNTLSIRNEIFYIINDLIKNNIVIEEPEKIYAELAIADEYDDKDTIFIKRLLQHYLHNELRSEILSKLFNKYVTSNEKAFAKQLYINKNQINEMCRHGMHFGNHTDRHNWLSKLNINEQISEIDNCLDFLDSNIENFDSNNWSICYPYGSYNDQTLEICKSKGCSIGFTTKPKLADLSVNNLLKLERLDTNEFPISPDSKPNYWTSAVLSEKFL